MLYLMILTLGSKEPWNVSRDARIFARLLDLSQDDRGKSIISKLLGRLKDANLIRVERKNRRANIFLLHESGNGETYTYPDPKTGDRYLQLPLTFWTEGWYRKLELPGLAMLLILLAEKDEVVLPLERIPDWYGISRSTAQRGIAELLGCGLIVKWVTQRKAPLAPLGYTFDTHYRLVGPFARSTRRPAEPEVPQLEDTATITSAQRRRSRRRKPQPTTETKGGKSP